MEWDVQRRLLVLIVVALGLALSATAPAAESPDPFAIPDEVSQEAPWTTGAGLGDPFSYNCPPTVDVFDTKLIAPSGWAPFLADELLDDLWRSEAKNAIDDAADVWWDNYQSGLQVDPQRVAAFPAGVGADTLAGLKTFLRGRILGALTSASFWNGVVQRAGGVPMPEGVDPGQFLALVPELYDLRSGCGFVSHVGDRGVRAWLTSRAAFLQDEGTGDFARVVFDGQLPPFGPKMSLKVVPGANVPTWLVIGPGAGLYTDRLEGLLRIPNTVTHESCGPDNRSLTETQTSIANVAYGSARELTSWASWLPFVSIALPDVEWTARMSWRSTRPSRPSSNSTRCRYG